RLQPRSIQDESVSYRNVTRVSDSTGPGAQRPPPHDADGEAEGDRDHSERPVHDVEAHRAVLAGHVHEPRDPDEERPPARGEEEDRDAPRHDAVAMASSACWIAPDDALRSGSRTSGVGIRPWAWRTPLNTAGFGSANRACVTGSSASAWERP